MSAGQWHARPVVEIASILDSDPAQGISPEQASARLARDGPNELRKAEVASPLSILAGQFTSLVVWILIGAAVVSAMLGELADGIAIGAIVALNALIGFFQEYRAEQAVAALARLAAPKARVVRGGRAEIVSTRDIVRGDVLLIEAGDLVGADARLIEASMLRTNEAPLTGESEPVEKIAGDCAPETPLAERRSMLFLGTSVTSGSGRALVVATGMGTEVGRIAGLLETASGGDTPLKQRLDQVSRRLLLACSGIVVLVFVLGAVRGIPAFELFLTAVSLSVAAIPEGLPAIVTVALALGVSRMARHHALVRRLLAVETLGCAQVICTDKTGTLTVGEMTARKLVTLEGAYGMTGEGYSTDGAIFAGGSESTPEAEPVLLDLLRAAAACNDAELTQREGRPAIVGDPTEGALLVAAAKGGLTRSAVELEMPRLGVIPFDSDRKRMTVVRQRDGQAWAFVKGAPEVIVQRCSQVRTRGGIEPLSEEKRARIDSSCTLMASDALRVLALAERRLDRFGSSAGTADADDVEQGLTFLGLVGLQDPPRAEARDAVAKCKRAGIRVVMITGDHPDTAHAIARELGILEPGDQVVVGSELARMDDRSLAEHVPRIVAYARVTAEDKLRIVRAWKEQGAVVAMTGDGVNDAPALKEASIGIAMGLTGTEVTKEAADMVITDDNFASIVAAVAEGRGIYDNIAKTLGYLLAGNAGELAVMLIAVLLGWPLPLLPIQLLWINLVTDGLPALALATDPIDPDVLSRPPRSPDAELIDRRFVVRLAITGMLTAACTLAAFAYELAASSSVASARNAGFSVLVIAELLRSFGARSDTRTIFEVGLLSNLRLFIVVVASFTLQLVIHHAPPLARVFGTEPISVAQCLAWVVLGAIPLVVLEMHKLARRGGGWPRRVAVAAGVLAAVAIAPVASAAAEPLRLEAFLDQVRKQSPRLAAAQLRAEAQVQRVDPAGTLDDPFFAAGPDGIPFSGGGGARIIRYQLAQAVPFPGKLGARAEVAAERGRAAEADAATIARELEVIATQTFYRALHNQLAIELNRELTKLVDEATESGRARYQVGAPSHHEWLLARAELGVLEADRVRLDNQRATLHAALNELRSEPASTRIERLAAELPPSTDVAEGVPDAPAVTNAASPESEAASPETASLDAVVRAAEAEQHAARLAYLPDFVVQGMAEQPRHAASDDPMWGVMVGVNLPIFWWRKQNDLLAAATREREAALAERRTIENRLEAERVAAREQLVSARRTAQLYEQSVLPLTRLALESARSGYAVGTVPLAELISVARAHQVQDLEYLATRIDVELARTRLRHLLSAPPLLQLAPATPTLFGAGMGALGGGMAGAGGMGSPSAISVGRGMGLGAGRGMQPAEPGSGSGTRGMGGM